MFAGEALWRGWVLLTLWEPGVVRALLEVSGKVGRGVELPCGEQEPLGGQQNVTWTRFQHNHSQLLASLATGDREEFRGRLSLVHNGILHLLIHNLTQEDSGDYTCFDSNGNEFPSRLHVSGHPAWHVKRGESFYLNCTGEEEEEEAEITSEEQNDVSKPTLSRCLGGDIWIPCGKSSADPFRWEDRRAASNGKGSSAVIQRVLLRQGYGVTLIGRPSMVILRLRYRDAGVYACRTNGTDYRVRLAVVGPDIVEFLANWWVLLLTIICVLCLYGLFLGGMLRLRNSRKRKVHNERISRIMRSLSRNKTGSRIQLNGSYSRRLSDTGQNGAVEKEEEEEEEEKEFPSTSYENLASHEPEGGNPSLRDSHSEGVEAAQSYENLCTAQDQISDDYLVPDQEGGSDGGSDGGSSDSEDYLQADGDLTPESETPVQIHCSIGLEAEGQRLRSLYAAPKRKEDGGRGESSDEDYAVPDPDSPVGLEMNRLRPHSDGSEIYEQMEGRQQEHWGPFSDQNEEDYEKMEASHYTNTRGRGARVEETLEEEYMRMEQSIHRKV